MRQQTAGSRVRVYAAVLAATAAALTTFTAGAGAATFTATDTTSFVAAVASANGTTGPNTIIASGTSYTPKSTLEFTNTSGPLTIQGPSPVPSMSATPAKFVGGAIVPTGASLFKVDANVTVNFVDIAVSNAGMTGNPAIDDFGTVNITQTGIAGTNGAGLGIEFSGSANIVNSTISDGLDIGIIDAGTATLTNSTVTRNINGGVDNASGKLHLINSIIAKNNNPTSSDCTAAVTSSDHSLDGDSTCGVGALAGKDPKLGSIGLHGGSTPTALPGATSPVLDAGNPAACPNVDQRGAARPDDAGTACDIGSVERYLAGPSLVASNITTTTGSASGKVVDYTATFTDAGAPITTQSCTPATHTQFPLGTSTVNCTATDGFGNTGGGSFTITITQVNTTTPPTITVPADQMVEATSAAGAPVTFSATATDPVDGTVAVTCTPASGATFPLGPTTVSCAATDSNNNTATKTFKVTVADTTPPVITVPGDMTVSATGPGGAVVNYGASALDNVDGTDTVTCVPPSGATFALGTTNVTCNASDHAGNHAVPTAFRVTVVVDTRPPVFTTPGNLSVEATSSAGAPVTYVVTAVDARTGAAVNAACTPVSGATFPIAVTTVNCSATDGRGNTGTASFTVTVADNTPPAINVPPDAAVAATKPSGAVVTYAVTAVDLVDGAVTPTCTPASGSTFPVGTTTVNCSAADLAANTATASFKVTVRDTTPPVITVPAAMKVTATSATGTPVTYTVTATDNVDGTVIATCTPPSGANFPVGATTVSCTAKDKAANTGTAAFTVTVSAPSAPPPTTPPVITVPANITTNAPSPMGAAVSFKATATDTSGASPAVTCTPASGSTFPVGATTVNCTAKNVVGTTSAAFTVTVNPPLGDVAGLPRAALARITSATTSGGVATIKVACRGATSSRCRVTVALVSLSGGTARKVAKTHGKVIASRTAILAGGHKTTLRLTLNKAAVGQLKKLHKLTVQLRLTQSIDGDSPTSHTRWLAFKG